MSLASKLTLAASACVAVAIVGYVHMRQKEDQAKLREGVIRDVERQHMRQTQNLMRLQEQVELTKRIRQEYGLPEESEGKS